MCMALLCLLLDHHHVCLCTKSKFVFADFFVCVSIDLSTGNLPFWINNLRYSVENRKSQMSYTLHVQHLPCAVPTVS